MLHADTTSFSVRGHYEPSYGEDLPLDITHGFSRDKRPDLTQFQVGLGVYCDGVWLIWEILDSNAGDSDWNSQLIEAVTDWTNDDSPPIYVAVSKAVTKYTLRTAGANDVDIISRLPRTFTLADDPFEQALETDLEDWAACPVSRPRRRGTVSTHGLRGHAGRTNCPWDRRAFIECGRAK